MKSRFPKNRLLSITLLIAMVVALAYAMGATNRSFNNSARAESTEASIVATVEGRQITSKIYRMYLKNGIEALSLSDKNEEGRRKIEQLKEAIISDLVDRALIEAEARRRGLAIPDETLAAAFNRRVAEMGGDVGYRAYLKETAITDEDFRQIVSQELYGELLRKDFEKGVVITEAESKAFYEKEKTNEKYQSLFLEPEQVRASHILVAARRSLIANELREKGITDKAQLDRAIEEEIRKRRERASALLSKARAGADFAALARENSDDQGTKDRGGDLGLFARNTHTAKFDEAVFSLKSGTLGGIVETDYGFHIIKVAEHNQQRTRTFAEVRSQIEQRIATKKLAEQLNTWLAERRRSADVKIAPGYSAGQFQAKQ